MKRHVATLLLTTLLSWTKTQAHLTVTPDSSQFLRWDSVVLTCEDSDWTVRRTTSRETGACCGPDLDRAEPVRTELDRSSCRFDFIDPMDSGSYWCESDQGQSSESVNISVRDKGVVLQVPVLPVTEGQTVFMSCRLHTSSNQTARFHRDGNFLYEGPTGHMTIQQVSASHQGLYHCEIKGESSGSSPLLITPGKPSAPPPSPETPPPSQRPLPLALLCHLLVLCPYVVSTVLMVSLYRQVGSVKEGHVSIVMTSPAKAATGLDERGDDITVVTTEYEF